MTRPWVTRFDPELAEKLKAAYDGYMQEIEEIQSEHAETKGEEFARSNTATDEQADEAKAEREAGYTHLAAQMHSPRDFVHIEPPEDMSGFSGPALGAGIPPKFTKGKPKFELIFPEAMLELAKIRTSGAEVHGPYSWHKINMLDLIGACHRHLNKIERGMKIDDNSTFYHAAHLMCQAMFIFQNHFESMSFDAGGTANEN